MSKDDKSGRSRLDRITNVIRPSIDVVYGICRGLPSDPSLLTLNVMSTDFLNTQDVSAILNDIT